MTGAAFLGGPVGLVGSGSSIVFPGASNVTSKSRPDELEELLLVEEDTDVLELLDEDELRELDEELETLDELELPDELLLEDDEPGKDDELLEEKLEELLLDELEELDEELELLDELELLGELLLEDDELGKDDELLEEELLSEDDPDASPNALPAKKLLNLPSGFQNGSLAKFGGFIMRPFVKLDKL